MHKFLLTLLLALALGGTLAMAANASSDKQVEPSIEQRLADIESYLNNSARATDGKAVSKIAGPGPAHNGWMMVSSALVLFMTSPGASWFT